MSKAWTFGDNVNTDEIIPGRFNMTTDPNELAKYVFCEIRPDLVTNINKGDIIVGGNNFGCGSSREHAPIAIKGAKVKCILAKSYARIFFRNAINIGLPILEIDTSKINEGDDLEVDLNTGIIKNNTTNKEHQANALPKFVMKIVKAGGIVNFLQINDVEELE